MSMKKLFKITSIVTLVALAMMIVVGTANAAFRASSLATPSLMVDNFNGYNSTQTMKNVWSLYGSGVTYTLSSTGGVGGTKAMQFQAQSGTTVTWASFNGAVATAVSNWSGSDGLEFWIKNNALSKIDLGVEVTESYTFTDARAFGGLWNGTAYLQVADGSWTPVPYNGAQVSIPTGFTGAVRIPWAQMREAEWQCPNPNHDPALCNTPIRLQNMGQVSIGFAPNGFQTNVVTVDDVGVYVGDMSVSPTATPYPTYVAPALTKHSLTYAPSPADNPLKGFLPYRNPLDDGYYGQPGQTTAMYAQFPYSQEFQYLPLKDLMNGSNSFTWGPLDTVLADSASRGHTIVLRVYLDYPNKPGGIPQFLLNGGLVTHSYTFYNNGVTGTSVSPNYDDPNLLAAIDNFVAALATRYDGDPRIGFIQVGLIGFWGEWHTYPMDGYCDGNPTGCADWMPSAASQSRVIHDFANNFHNTRIILRQPMADSASLPIGYHDDSFAFETLPPPYPGGESWMFWGHIQSALATNIWKTQPIGGEMRPEIQLQMWDNDPPIYTGPAIGTETGQDYYTCLNTTHASWMLIQGVFANTLPEPQHSRAVEAARRMGYEFTVPESYFNDIPSGGSLPVSVAIKNSGIAPFYYPWNVQLGAKNGGGAVVQTWNTNWNITDIQPGQTTLFNFSTATPGLAAGQYSLVLRIVNPLANGNLFRFGNTTQGSDGWLNLGTLNVGSGPTWTPAPPTSTPTKTNTPSGPTLTPTRTSTAVGPTATSTPTVAPGGNLALNKTTTTSSTYGTSNTGAAAVDGNVTTFWRTSRNNGLTSEWMTVDLGSSMTFNQVILKWGSNYAKSYTIRVSPDNSTWTTLYTTTAAIGGNETINFSSTSARYVQMNSTAWFNKLEHIWLYEFEVH